MLAIDDQRGKALGNGMHNFGERLGGRFNNEEDIFDLNEKSNLVILRESQQRFGNKDKVNGFEDHKTER